MKRRRRRNPKAAARLSRARVPAGAQDGGLGSGGSGGRSRGGGALNSPGGGLLGVRARPGLRGWWAAAATGLG
jgi:hypothetical protein